MKKNFVFYLGGGYSDRYIISDLNKNGFIVILSDINPCSPAKRYANYFLNVDNLNTKELCTLAESFPIEGNNILVYPSSERFLNSACVLSRKLKAINLSTIPWGLDKKKQKSFFAEHNLSTPPAKISSDDLTYPVVIKPVTGWASQEVKILTNSYDLENYLAKKEKVFEYLLESYCQGREITIGGCLVNDNYNPLFAYETTPYPKNLQVEYLVTLDINDKDAKLSHKVLEKIARNTLECGIITANFIIEEEPLVLEFTQVVSQSYLNLIILAYGFSPLTLCFKKIIGDEIGVVNYEKQTLGLKQLFTKNDGKRFVDIKKYSSQINGNILGIHLIRPKGSVFQKIKDTYISYLTIYASGESRSKVCKYLDREHDNINIMKETVK